MPGNLKFDQLKKAVKNGAIDTVVVAIPAEHVRTRFRMTDSPLS